MHLIFIVLFCSFVFRVYGFPDSAVRCHRELFVIEQCFEAFPFSSKNWEAPDFYEDLENYDSWKTCVSPSKCSKSLRRIEKVKTSFELHKFYADNLQECLGSGVLENLTLTCNQDCNPMAYLKCGKKFLEEQDTCDPADIQNFESQYEKFELFCKLKRSH